MVGVTNTEKAFRDRMRAQAAAVDSAIKGVESVECLLREFAPEEASKLIGRLREKGKYYWEQIRIVEKLDGWR